MPCRGPVSLSVKHRPDNARYLAKGPFEELLALAPLGNAHALTHNGLQYTHEHDGGIVGSSSSARASMRFLMAPEISETSKADRAHHALVCEDDAQPGVICDTWCHLAKAMMQSSSGRLGSS